MSKIKSYKPAPGELSTIIGKDAVLIGHLKVQASMRIDGSVQGELSSADTITLGKDGNVEGDITAKDIIIGGKISGKLSASGKIVLESKSVLNGDLKTSRLIVEEGAIFNGSCDMGGIENLKKHPPREIKLSSD
ncbi:MAG: polymer-forming cytoskeletal protein [Bacteroidetes bacterium]|nr:polymer-forming cytoskeletal protein [Bacteroidota bacterium]